MSASLSGSRATAAADARHDFSLIMGTLGRSKEIAEFIESLYAQAGGRSWELIVVDQNADDRVDQVVAAAGAPPAGCRVEIIKEPIKGLSRARNVGLKKAGGRIIAFPDDDCVYSREVLDFVANLLGEEERVADVVSLFDVSDRRELESSGPEGHRSVTPYTLFARAISYTIFASEAAVARAGFDEDFGVGAMFGAAEETDFLFAILSNGGRVIQSSGPRIFHPNKTQDFKDVQRVSSYNVGIGAFFAKNLSLRFPGLLAFYLVSNLKLLVRLAQFALTGNALKLRWYWLIFSNRHLGALRYLAHVRRRRAHQRHVPPYPPHADQ